MTWSDYETYDAAGLARLVADGETTPGELLDAALMRAEGRNPRLNALVHLQPEVARRLIEDGLPDGPLCGAALLPLTAVFNAGGEPAVSLPLYWTADGLPVGVQLATALGADELLPSLASQLEAAQPWFDHRPPAANRLLGRASGTS